MVDWHETNRQINKPADDATLVETQLNYTGSRLQMLVCACVCLSVQCDVTHGVGSSSGVWPLLSFHVPSR